MITKEMFEATLSEMSHQHQSGGKECESCNFLQGLKGSALQVPFCEFITRAMTDINPIQALLEPTEMFGILTAVFLLGRKLGRKEILAEQLENLNTGGNQ